MAVIGCGNRAGRVFDSFARQTGVQWVAACEVNKAKLDSWMNPARQTFKLDVVGDYRRIIPRLAEIGYQGVELQTRNPAEFDPDALGDCARDAGIEIVAVSSAALGTEDRLYLMSPDADVRRAAIERYKLVLELAASYGVDASIGRFRGWASWAPDRATAARFPLARSFAMASTRAAAASSLRSRESRTSARRSRAFA